MVANEKGKYKMIPYGRQWIDEDDIHAVVKVLRSDWITQGPIIEQFEKELANYCEAKYAVAVSSGTAALHLACLAAGIKEGDEVITSPITFVASANCVIYCGGKPSFADINPETININPQEIKKRINKKTKAIIPVHFAGLPCEMEEISKIAEEHNLTVIEDACHALGAEYKTHNGEWVKVGSCHHSDMTVFSFHPVKNITTGEGGAITTNNEKLYEKLLMLRNHGITKNRSQFMSHDYSKDVGPWYYEMQMLGFNYRITDFQCALGLKQLRKIKDWLVIRKKIAQTYNDRLAKFVFVSLPNEPNNSRSSYHLYVIKVEKRDYFFNKLTSAGVDVQVHYIPVYFHPYYKKLHLQADCPNAERYFKQAVSLPIFPKLSEEDINYVINIIKNICEKT